MSEALRAHDEAKHDDAEHRQALQALAFLRGYYGRGRVFLVWDSMHVSRRQMPYDEVVALMESATRERQRELGVIR